MLERGFVFTHEAVRDREARLAPLFAEQLHTQRRGHAKHHGYVDETYVKVQGKWCYLYRAIDRDGNLVDSRLFSERKYGSIPHFCPKFGDHNSAIPSSWQYPHSRISSSVA